MTCFYCGEKTKTGLVRCKSCANATLTSDSSIARQLEIKDKVKGIDNYQRNNNISV